jgi:amino acid transporter
VPPEPPLPSLLPETPAGDEQPSWGQRVRRVLIGRPRDLADRSLFHRLSLVPFLAWVGLGADGLSSSAYGPDEAYRTLFTDAGAHTYLALGLAGMTAMTVFVIASAYSRIIEQFPHGGGGYVVATKLLGGRIGVISGCALLVDYMLTITVSIAAAGDALFSMVPPQLHLLHIPLMDLKLPMELLFIVGLTTINIRGAKESVLALTPIFILFLVTHLVLIGGGIFSHAHQIPQVASSVSTGFHQGLTTLGIGGMLLLFVHAYSMGGGTYTGLEAVSNGMPIMREPRVKTAQRTMVYMALSLAFTAGGLLVCYLLWNVTAIKDNTLNAVLVKKFVGSSAFGPLFVFLTLASEGALLIVGAQAGFLDGPRIVANMAVDSWAPRRFSALSDRLTTQNGIVLMGVASLAALLYTQGDVRHLVVMYSINVFLTFSLSMFAMARLWSGRRKERTWKRHTALFGFGFVLCLTILVITVLEKFTQGGWITLVVTSSFVVVCFIIRRHYTIVAAQFAKLDEALKAIERVPMPAATPPELDPSKPTAVLLVGSYSGLGIHTLLQIHRTFPHHFRNIVFVSVGVIDSGKFKGEDELHALRDSAEATLKKYVELARRLGFAATSRLAVGTEVVSEAEQLCLQVAKEFSHVVFFTGRVIFQREHWYHRLLHNQTAYAIQKRLQWIGMPMVIMPVRIRAS